MRYFHVLTKIILVAMAALLIASPVAGANPSSEELALISLVNAERARVGAKPLIWQSRMEAAARHHTYDMLRNDFFAHTSPTQGNLATRLKRFGIYRWRRAGENLAGALTAEVAFDLFMNSQSHRDNMLNPNYTHIGVGYVRGGPYGGMFTMELADHPSR